ncbi:MAG: LamG-like jellyroll fold domain-containing protein [Phaeodactylibacter sp.]|uniref:LamG-like jellyroll fold domain-containing protein n=1 Tax=Phaeodactylibacter sp. TaxID=1940289 RepID=UPI0032EBD175
MKHLYIMVCMLLLGSPALYAQLDTTNCNPTEGLPVAQATVQFYYGSTADAFSNLNRANVTIGQPLIGSTLSQENTADFGFWASFVSPPQPPVVMATQGDFPDRVELMWEMDALSPQASEGFTIVRDGAFLSDVDPGIFQFIDFNVQAGEFYEYSIVPKNQFGSGSAGRDIGFVNPNGVVLGKVTTQNGNPVVGAVVTLTPTVGRSMAFDGQGANLCVSHHPAIPYEMFTASAWVKLGDGNDRAGIFDLGSDLNRNYWILTTPAGMGKGIVVGVGNGTGAEEITYAFEDEPDGWHHLAAVYGGGTLILYVDGKFISTVNVDITSDDATYAIGSRRDQTGFFNGNIDDVRLYNRLLPQSELILTKDITVSKNTEGIVAYWKFDEGRGRKAFDLSNNGIDAAINSATFSSDTPDLLNAGITDIDGFYAIEGVNYSTVQSFTARPGKIFYDNYALEFNAAYEAYATLTDYDLADSATVTLTVQPFDIQSRQTLLSKGSGDFEFFIDNGQYQLTVNGETQILGMPSDTGYQHLTFIMDAGNNEVRFYQENADVVTLSYGSLTGDWTGEPWVLGAKGATMPQYFYTGLIDEVAFYDVILPDTDRELIASRFGDGGTDTGYDGLEVYFPLNEGEGEELFDFGALMTGEGAIQSAVFSTIARVQDERPHEFSPNVRVVNINNTNTAVNNVDFTDESTVPISGVVRFENTFCYQDSVEILVNGASYVPPIFTNEEGRFVADFEPGANVKLTPKFGADSTAHDYFPGFFEARKLNSPVANVLFQNLTKREIEGQVYGGLCRRSVIPPDDNGDPAAIVKVKLSALNGCYEEELQLQTLDGKFKFDNIPPIPVAVSVTEHSNSVIYDYFQVQGGTEVDLRNILKDTVDFMYISPPNVEIAEIRSGLLGNECDLPLIKDSQEFSNPKLYSNDIRVFQTYDGGVCYLDTFALSINNGIQESDQEQIFSDSSTYVYEWFANNPNMLPPHTKNMQVTAEVEGLQATETYGVIVLGERQLPGTISTSGPSEVFGIVYDPPGDGSFATLAQGTETCVTWEDVNVNSENASTDIALKKGKKLELFKGLGGGIITTFEASNTTTISGSFEASQSNSNEAEFCFTTTKEISTSDGDDIWGTYADVYFGAATNFEIGARDILDYDFDNCNFTFDQVLTIAPIGFATDFVFSEWQIITEVIPQLEEIIANPTVSEVQREQAQISRDKWVTEVANKRARQRAAEYSRNITFDAATTYTETTSSTMTGTNTWTTTIGGGGGIQNEHGWEYSGFGVDWTIQASYNHTNETTEGISSSNTVETSFTLADDDLNDFYSIDIATGPQPNIGFDDLEDLEDEVDALEDQISSLYEFDNSITNTNYQVSSLSKAPFATAPMFKLVGGESMCPWIPGTRNREEVSVQVAENVAINVPDNTPAVFQVTLGSIGPNGVDGLIYELGVDEGGNPDGALIKLDGEPLINPVEFQFIGNQSFNKTVTVEYPNTGQFTFEDLGLYFASTCQIEHSESVGFDAGDGGFLIYDEYQPVALQNGEKEVYSRFYQPLELDVFFIEPCTPIDIAFPLQNHVVTPGNENLFVTLSEYDNEDADLDIVRLQYRPIPGDGSWINILELPADSFANDPVFKIVQWDMMELKDGAYELRAIADCAGTIGGDLSPGISEVIRVVKETEAPELFGAPQPADGILGRGDEISITFNEAINCNKVFDADGIGTNINLNNIALIDTETGALVPFSSQCVGDKIIITPEIQTKFINGKTLRAIATDIEDLAGNPMEVPIGAPGSPTVNFRAWEFLVDLNPLRWTAGSDIDEVVNEGNSLVVTRDIVNQSGTPMNFSITGPRINNPDGSVAYGSIPSWVTVAPTDGTLDPGEQEEVTFVFADNLPQNEYTTQINVVGTDGNKTIDVDLRVACEGPGWEVNPAGFAYSMTMTAELDIEGTMSTDNLDLIGAFVGSELRGVAAVEYVPEIQKYLAFLTIYSNNLVGETVTFQIWDARECTLYGSTDESFDFVADDLIGSPIAPQVIHTNNLLLRKIPIFPGWNWISYNLELPDPGINAALASLTRPEDATIKGQTSFSQYFNGGSVWAGSLTELSHLTMYQYNGTAFDSLVILGNPIDPATPMSLSAGWNWIGYLPQAGMPVNQALASLSPLNGDIIKSQAGFAQYVAGVGWVGNLNFMSSPNGYLLNLGAPGTLMYPESFNGPNVEAFRKQNGVETRSASQWEVDPHQYEHSMNLIAVVTDAEMGNLLHEEDEVGAFINGEVRGSAQPIYVEAIDAYLLFLTVYGNAEGGDVEFKYYDGADGEVKTIEESFVFIANDILGTVNLPEPLTLQSVTGTESLASAAPRFELYPNPATDRVYLSFDAPAAAEIMVVVMDATGREVARIETEATAGSNLLEWRPNSLAAGLYFVTLHGNGQVQSAKLNLQP